MDVDTDCGTNKPVVASNCGNKESKAGDFECNICFDISRDPVVTLCGHLYCWPCLYQWLQLHFYSHECPVCKAIIEEDKLVPIYGRGKECSNPSIPQPFSDLCIPKRPVGQRPPTAPPVQIRYFRQEEPAPTGFERLSSFFDILVGIFRAPGNGMDDTSVYEGRSTSGFPFFPISFHGGGFGPGSNRFDEKSFFLKMFFLFLSILILAQMIF